jgi:hypothetical protein
MKTLRLEHGPRMPQMRWAAVLALLGAHGTLVALGDALSGVLAPVIAGTVYLPLWMLESVGLPVFGRAEAGGWAAPNMLGWLLVAVIWTTLWWLLVAAISRVRA